MFLPSSHSGLTKSSFNPIFFSPDIPQIFLSWYVGLTNHLEPLNIQSTPPAPAREAATCFGVVGNADTGFSALRRRHASIYAGVFFQTYPLTHYTSGGKGETQPAVSFLTAFAQLSHSITRPKSRSRVGGLEPGCRRGWRLRNSRDQLLSQTKERRKAACLNLSVQPYKYRTHCKFPGFAHDSQVETKPRIILKIH